MGDSQLKFSDFAKYGTDGWYGGVKPVVCSTSHIVPQFRNNMSWTGVEMRIWNDETNISRPT